MSAPIGKPTPAVLVTPDDVTRKPVAKLPDPAAPAPASMPPAAPTAAPDAAAPAAKPAGRGGKGRARRHEPSEEELSREPVRPVAGKARMKRRHYGMIATLVLLVVMPVLASAWYLYNRAADQYASFVGFSVRSESAPGASELLGGLGAMVGVAGNTTTDTDILYKFIHSRDLVERVNARLDLREIWSKAPNDPIFTFRGGGALEDLSREWDRKVSIQYDTGMIDLRVLAFDPQDAQAIAQTILDESGRLINELNDIAREDTLRYAREELNRAQERLTEARQQMAQFRNQHQLVDPVADVQGQMGVVSSLQAQLAEQLVSLGMLQANAQPSDPRISQTELRIDVIREQMEAERRKFTSDSEVALSDVVGQFEVLSVDREFAERSYTAALAGYEAARAEAMRQSRYIAPYIRPTLAQDAEFPQRPLLLMMIFGFLLAMWLIGTMIFYSLRDRR